MKGFFRTRGIKERMDTVKEGYRKGGSRTGGMKNRRYAGQWTGGMMERRDVRMEGCRKEECMKKEGCRKGKLKGRTGCRKELHFVSSLSYTTVINSNRYLFLTVSKS